MEPMTPMKPMEPMKPLDFGPPWWPESLGQPSTSGGQNDMRYAVFPDKRRLLVERHGECRTFDTGDHRIGGVQQQNGGEPSFSSQHGTVRLESLREIETSDVDPDRGGDERHGNHPREGGRHEARGHDEGRGRPRRHREGDDHDGRHRDEHRRQEERAAGHDDAGDARSGAGERTVFIEESGEASSIRLAVRGRIDADMLESLEDFIRRQKRRLDRGG